REAIPALIQLLQDENEDVRRATAEALGKLKAREAIPTLIQLLQDEAWPVRQAAAEALGKLEAREAIPALIQLLQDEAGFVRRATAEALGKLKAREAIPTLIQLLQDEDRDVRWAAAQALTALPPEMVLSALRPLWAHPDPWVRREVIPLYERVRRNAGWPREGEASGPYLARGALQAMVTLADETLTRIPSWLLAIRRKAEALRRLGHAEAALKALEGVESLERASVSVSDGERGAWGVERALCLAALGRRDEALTVVRQVAAEAGNEPAILADCADLLEKLDVLEEAKALYTRVIELEDWASYYRNRADFYIRRGRHAEAKADLARAAEKEPWHPDTYGLQGQLMLAQGQFAEAHSALEQAARRDPHDVSWQYGIAFAHLGLGQTEQGMAALEEALDRTELHEDVEDALQLLALLERAQPELPDIATARERILARKALLDQLAAQGD
ncbi:MAG: tetratricopeptide repeat protein, partial [Chloroflexi bacterium]|nr:tetratricopeptide repeat protein [Chloroflexota bacterium]